MTDDQWNQDDLKTVTIFLGGGSIEQSTRGEQITDTDVLWLINASADDTEFRLPAEQWGQQWRCVLDTATGEINSPEAATVHAGASLQLIGRSQMLFVRHEPDQ